MTSDTKAAESFYRNVIGWEAKDSGMADRSYTILSVGPMMRQLRAKGAFLISSDQHSGVVTSIEVISEQGGPLIIQSPWGMRGIRKDGAPAIIEPNDRGQITLNTMRGGHYHLTPSGIKHLRRLCF